MENTEHKLEPEPSFAQRPDVGERLAAYQESKDQVKEERAREFGGGITLEPKPGKHYRQLQGSEGSLALALTYGDEKRGGAVLEVPNGAYVEVDGKGQPLNEIVRDYFGNGKNSEKETARWELLEYAQEK